MKKQTIKFLMFFFVIVLSVPAFAIIEVKDISQPTPQTGSLSMTITDYEKLSGKKLNFIQKMQFKLAQKYAAKKSETDKSDKKTLSLIALIAGGSSIITTLLALPILGLLLALAGIIFGFISLKKEKAKTMSILGIVFGGLTLILILLLVVLLATIGFV